MMKNISVQTLPNGYSLKFDGAVQKTGYFYFSPEQLLEGFMMHIGLGMTQQLDTQTMADFIATAIAWNDNSKCIKEIERLKLDMKLQEQKRHALAIRLIVERRNRKKLAEEVAGMAKRYEDYSDPIIKERLNKMLKGNAHLATLTLRDLGIDADEIDSNDMDDNDDL